MQYIFVAYIYYLNAILVHAKPSKNDAAMISAFTNILATLAALGYKPTHSITENKYSKMAEANIKFNKMDIHLGPPHNQRVNAAKRAIATFKEQFIVGLATVNRNCPLQLWDKILQQVKLTLSLCCFSGRDPSKSAKREVNGFLTSTKPPLGHLEQKVLSTMTLPSAPAWGHTGLIHFKSALPPSIIGV
jgi:hypothetical protein